MIKDQLTIHALAKRRAFWREHHRICCQGDTIAAPYKAIEGYQEIFKDKRVLEIGPGEGRQFKALRSLAKHYAVADIVPEVLERSLYEEADERFLIETYDDVYFGSRFDVITFWYVLHHVRLDEGSAFFDFLVRHLNPGGCLLFNAPWTDPSGRYSKGNGDGLSTTAWERERILTMLDERQLTTEMQIELAPNCLVLLARANNSSLKCD